MGEGTMLFNTKVLYEGHFQDGILNGLGVLTWPDNSYEGELRGGDKSGAGVYQNTANGGKVEQAGQWNSGFFTGYGIITTSNGLKYAGHFTKSALDGLGAVLGPDWRVVSQGKFEAGKLITPLAPD